MFKSGLLLNALPFKGSAVIVYEYRYTSVCSFETFVMSMMMDLCHS